MSWQAKTTKIWRLPASWQSFVWGKRYSTLVQQYFSPWFAQILGYQILKIGGLSAELNCQLPLRHQILLSPNIDDLQNSEFTSIQASLQQLPFVEKSIDACFLIQTLNFCSDPHQLLRELQRVIAEDGYLFLSLFNPLFPLNWSYKCRQLPSCLVQDWLNLLNFEVIEQQNLGLPCLSNFAPLTVLVAQKRPYSLHLKPQVLRFEQATIFNPLEAYKQCK